MQATVHQRYSIGNVCHCIASQPAGCIAFTNTRADAARTESSESSKGKEGEETKQNE
jgi:hypothetical protein